MQFSTVDCVTAVYTAEMFSVSENTKLLLFVAWVIAVAAAALAVWMGELAFRTLR